MIEYKILKEKSMWSMSGLEKAIAKRINEHAKDGWRLVSLSFSYGYYAHAAMERDASNKDFV